MSYLLKAVETYMALTEEEILATVEDIRTSGADAVGAYEMAAHSTKHKQTKSADYYLAVVTKVYATEKDYAG